MKITVLDYKVEVSAPTEQFKRFCNETLTKVAYGSAGEDFKLDIEDLDSQREQIIHALDLSMEEVEDLERVHLKYERSFMDDFHEILSND